MKKDLYITLVYKKLKGEINEEEKRVLDDWLLESENNVDTYKNIELQWKLSENYSPDIEIDVKADLLKLKERIKNSEIEPIGTPKKTIQLNTRKWIGLAASILVLISAGYWLTNSNSDYTTVSTVNNEKKHITLPDGSEIWLNENSELKYPNTFASDKREIVMEGEILFTIKKNKQAPFVIDAGSTKIKVLGTSFNVDINPNETKVDVRRGIVQFSTNNQKIILSKGESGTYNTIKNNISKTEYDINAFAWKSSVLVFSKKSFQETIKTIERYYEVNISFENMALKDCLFSGRFEDKSIDEVLQYLSDIYGFSTHKTSVLSYKFSGGTCL